MRKALPISLGIVLALGLLAGSAAAERVWTKSTTSLRAKPDAQSRRVARIRGNRSLMVVRKKGRWLKVKRGAKSGWVLRSDIRSKKRRRRRGRGGGRTAARGSQSRNAGSSSAADADGAGEASADDADDAGQATASDVTTSDASATPENPEGDPGDRDGAGSGDAGSTSGKGSNEPCRKDAVWCGRDRDGDALHVKVIPDRAQAYKEPGVNQEHAFLATKGQELVVIGYHRPDWFYVQTLEGRFGWIPKSAVLREESLRDPESPERLETRLDELPDLDPDSVRERGEGSSGQTDDTASSDEALTIDAVAAVGVGLLARSLSTTGGQANYEATSPGAVTHVATEARYRVSGSWHAGAEVVYTAMAGIPGMTYTPAGAAGVDLGSFILHRFTTTGSFGYVGGFAALLRAGFLVETFYLNDLFNQGKVPRERLLSPSVGVELGMADLVAGLDVTLQADVLLGGALAQTGGLEDGSFDGMTAAVGLLELSYPLGERLAIHGIYRFDLVAPNWTGASARAPGVNGASRTDVTHRVLGGIGMRF